MTFPIINYFPTIFFCASLGKMTTQLVSPPRKQAFTSSLAIVKPSKLLLALFQGLAASSRLQSKTFRPLTSAHSGRGGWALWPWPLLLLVTTTTSHPLGWWGTMSNVEEVILVSVLISAWIRVQNTIINHVGVLCNRLQ